MKCEYINDEVVEKIVRLLQTVKEQSKSPVYFKVYDTESVVVTTDCIEKLIEEIDGGDENLGIVIKEKGGENQTLGCAYIMPYEEDGVPYDYSDNDFMRKVMEKYDD